MKSDSVTFRFPSLLPAHCRLPFCPFCPSTGMFGYLRYIKLSAHSFIVYWLPTAQFWISTPPRCIAIVPLCVPTCFLVHLQPLSTFSELHHAFRCISHRNQPFFQIFTHIVILLQFFFSNYIQPYGFFLTTFIHLSTFIK